MSLWIAKHDHTAHTTVCKSCRVWQGIAEASVRGKKAPWVVVDALAITAGQTAMLCTFWFGDFALLAECSTGRRRKHTP